MTVITKRFGMYVSMGNLGLSPREVHCSPGKLAFLQRTIMSPGRRSLNCPKEQLKLFFLLGVITSSNKKILSPLKTWLHLGAT